MEAGIPEDDPRNPATIADNVGDNVGDVAGMGADLFGSTWPPCSPPWCWATTSSTTWAAASPTTWWHVHHPLPLIISALGIIFSILGSLVIRVKDGAKESEVQAALNKGNWGSIILTAIACFFLIDMMLPETLQMDFFGEGTRTFGSMNVFYSVIVGLVVGGAISYMTEYYTGLGKKPVLGIVQKSPPAPLPTSLPALPRHDLHLRTDPALRRGHLHQL